MIVYGHTPVKEVRKAGNTYNIDTGAVFGGKLSSLRYPELEIRICSFHNAICCRKVQ